MRIIFSNNSPSDPNSLGQVSRPRIGEDIDIIESSRLKLFYVSYTMVPNLPRAIFQFSTSLNLNPPAVETYSMS